MLQLYWFYKTYKISDHLLWTTMPEEGCMCISMRWSQMSRPRILRSGETHRSSSLPCSTRTSKKCLRLPPLPLRLNLFHSCKFFKTVSLLFFVVLKILFFNQFFQFCFQDFCFEGFYWIIEFTSIWPIAQWLSGISCSHKKNVQQSALGIFLNIPWFNHVASNSYFYRYILMKVKLLVNFQVEGFS